MSIWKEIFSHLKKCTTICGLWQRKKLTHLFVLVDDGLRQLLCFWWYSVWGSAEIINELLRVITSLFFIAEAAVDYSCTILSYSIRGQRILSEMKNGLLLELHWHANNFISNYMGWKMPQRHRIMELFVKLRNCQYFWRKILF